jgi:hypothetical protein
MFDISCVEANFLKGYAEHSLIICCLYDPLYENLAVVDYFFLKLNKLDPSSLRNSFCIQ